MINYIQVDEVPPEIDTNKLHLPPNGLTIIWKWIPLDRGNDGEDSSEDSSSGSSIDGDVTSETDQDYDSQPEDSQDASRCHRLKFKCIGSKKEQRYQDALRSAQDIIRRGHTVPVSLFKEPSNPRDSKAIAFKCQLDGKWQTIGYVISELLDEVHHAMDTAKINSVEFAWISFISDWRSGPGYFSGIYIEKRGQWSDLAKRKASTR